MAVGGGGSEIVIDVGDVRSVAELYDLFEKAFGIEPPWGRNADALYDLLSTAMVLGTVRLVSSKSLEQAIGAAEFHRMIRVFELASAYFRDHGLPHRLTLHLE